MQYTIGCEVGSPATVSDCLEYFKYIEVIQVDTETSGLDPHKDQIISLQLGGCGTQFFIDCRKVDILLFKELLESKLCVLQNSKFDYKMLKAKGIILNKIYDTMLAECVLYCGYEKFGYGLNKLVERYTGHILVKEERMGFISQGEKPFTEKQIEYGCLDVTYLEEIRDKQMVLAKTHELEYCVNLENNVVKALGDIEYNGMILDPKQWGELTESYKERLQKKKDQLDEIVLNDPKFAKFVPQGVQQDMFNPEPRKININYSSSVQMKKMFAALGENVDSTDDRQLSKFVGRDDKGVVLWEKHPFFTNLQDSRGLAKVVSTYGDGFLDYINPVTNRVHTTFWQVLNTGRVSSGDPNLQNLPADNAFRDCFKARPGFKWVSIDYSGQELRLMADASNEQGFIDVLNRGEDLHCYAGSLMFKRPITKADKDLRNKAKTINFGKPYGMGPDKLADTLGIPLAEAEELFKEYAKAFPKLNKWLEDQGKSANKKGYSVTFAPCKRKRWFPDVLKARELAKQSLSNNYKEIKKIESQTTRNGMNSPIQGSGADITKEALVDVRELVNWYNVGHGEEVAFLVMQVHDAIDVEVREDLAEEFSQAMANIMINCGNKYVTKVKMEVDTTITMAWKK